jgi:ATP-dependent exoDNAse (exonuclease V) beta subunit
MARASLESLAAAEARMLGLADQEAAAASAVVERLHAHELLVRARVAEARGACRRETPVACTMPDGTIVEGIVDLAFEEEARGWTVVDYKTDRELAAIGEDRYRRQVALYTSAIAAATGRPASGVLVRV